ncbi:hypothetical protein KRX56_01570 [Dermabacteraceae bacterium TAE3-ERU27]|nr:hypothetical protein [Dermabacteraceae bacterium TAE3-ERU27]
MMDIPSDQMAGRAETRFRASRGARMVAVAGLVVFSVMLEFLVIVSFLGRRIWHNPLLFHDWWFTLPFTLWLLIVLLGVLVIVRTTLGSLVMNSAGVRARTLLSSFSADWGEIASIYFIRDIRRNAASGDFLDPNGKGAAFDDVIFMSLSGRRIGSLSGRFFSGKAQRALLEEAKRQGVRVRFIDEITPAELASRIPGSLRLCDRHPGLMVLLMFVILLAHHAITFKIWGI